MNYSRNLLIAQHLIFGLFYSFQLTAARPRLTVIFVIDQFAHHYIEKLHPHFTGAFKMLLLNGIVYHNAHHPHAMPATATGHAALNTGAFACDHGIVGNGWFNKSGKLVKAEDDTASSTAVFNPRTNTVYPYGKSSHHLMVDGISDQMILNNQTTQPTHVLSVALKSRAAIFTAGKLGTPFWFDEKTGAFTSSKAYMPKLPDWVTRFNKHFLTPAITQVHWQRAYPALSAAYQFKHCNNYTYASHSSIIDTTIVSDDNKKEDFELLQATPFANKLLLGFAFQGIANALAKNPETHLLVWINLSSLDKIGHLFGPFAAETIDMIYHLDKQIDEFIKKINTLVPAQETVVVVTADHGVAPLPELLQEDGLPAAKRILFKELFDDVERTIAQKFNLPLPCMKFKVPWIYVDNQILATLSPRMQRNVFKEIQKLLHKKPGIKKIWVSKQLETASYNKRSRERYFKNQLFPERSGHITIQTFPHTAFYTHTTGAAHRTPYEYDTHVPLILYQQGVLEKKSIHTPVWTLQLANTLADILKIQHPSTAILPLLPNKH